MAISVGTVKRAYDFQALRTDLYTSTTEKDIMTCKVDVEWVTTAYAQANDATFAPATIIQNALRDGISVTVLQACPVAGGKYRLSAAPTTDVLCGALACTVSTNTVTVQLSAEDWATEMTDTEALNTSTWSQPLSFQVTFFSESVGQS
jgi:hypothetical protein